ncbi:MAG: TetR/AcrR family transcriptional regulator [Bacteroidota bacterium]
MQLKPKQKRSIATKNKIKQTARKLFTEEGYYEVTSNKIASTAGVPIGSFYNYFGNKKGVLLELIRDFNAKYHNRDLDRNLDLIANIQSASEAKELLPDLLRNALLSSQLADPFYRIIHSLQFTEADVLVLSEEVRQYEVAQLIQYLEKIQEYVPIKDIRLVAKMLHSMAENIGLYMHHLGSEFDQKSLIDETARMFEKYLF